MMRYRHGLTEPMRYLIDLYSQTIDAIPADQAERDMMYRFIDDPVHFDYDCFNENWWPLFLFSDLGLNAMRYGKPQVEVAFMRLQGKEKEKAEYYANIYTEKEEIDMTDIYHIPDHIQNPKI